MAAISARLPAGGPLGDGAEVEVRARPLLDGPGLPPVNEGPEEMSGTVVVVVAGVVLWLAGPPVLAPAAAAGFPPTPPVPAAPAPLAPVVDVAVPGTAKAPGDDVLTVALGPATRELRVVVEAGTVVGPGPGPVVVGPGGVVGLDRAPARTASTAAASLGSPASCRAPVTPSAAMAPALAPTPRGELA